jgi:hypothetical protein
MVPLPSCSSVPHQYQLFIPLLFSLPYCFLVPQRHCLIVAHSSCLTVQLHYCPTTPCFITSWLHRQFIAHCPTASLSTAPRPSFLFFYLFIWATALLHPIPLSNYILSHSSITSLCHCPIAPLSHGYAFIRQVLAIIWLSFCEICCFIILSNQVFEIFCWKQVKIRTKIGQRHCSVPFSA